MPEPLRVVSAQMSAARGRELRRMTSLPIDASAVRGWLVALYAPLPPPTDAWTMSCSGEQLVVPLDFNPFTPLIADPQGLPPRITTFGEWVEGTLGIDPPRTFGAALNVGMSVEYRGRRLRIGDVVTAVQRLGDYRVTSGQHPYLMTRLDEEWSDPSGTVFQLRSRTVSRPLTPRDVA